MANFSKHILVIRLSAMGDVAMSVPVLRTLTATYPDLKVTVVTRAFFTPMFNEIPNVSVYPADINGVHAGVTGLARLAKELRNLGVNAVADLHNVLRSNILKSVFFFYGIPVSQIDKGREEKKALTRANNKIFKPLKATHQRYADVFERMGYPIDLGKHQFPVKAKLTDAIIRVTGVEPKKWIGIAAFAQHDSKCYPEAQMEQVIAEIEKNPKAKILLFGGGASEKIVLENWESKFENAISVAGKLSFEEELKLISNLDIMLSMDSGNAHLAAMYGIPVISLWGVTHPYAGFTAFNQPMENCLLPDLQKYPAIPTSIYGNKYPEGYKHAIGSIPSERVVLKIKEYL